MDDEDARVNEAEMEEEDDTVDEDSDSYLTQTNRRLPCSRPDRERQGSGLGPRSEREVAAMIPSSTSTADADLLQRENARLRQLVSDLQSTFVGDRQETQRLNQNLENLTSVVGRLAGTAEQAPDQSSQSTVRTPERRAPRGGTLSVS